MLFVFILGIRGDRRTINKAWGQNNLPPDLVLTIENGVIGNEINQYPSIEWTMKIENKGGIVDNKKLTFIGSFMGRDLIDKNITWNNKSGTTGSICPDGVFKSGSIDFIGNFTFNTGGSFCIYKIEPQLKGSKVSNQTGYRDGTIGPAPGEINTSNNYSKGVFEFTPIINPSIEKKIGYGANCENPPVAGFKVGDTLCYKFTLTNQNANYHRPVNGSSLLFFDRLPDGINFLFNCTLPAGCIINQVNGMSTITLTNNKLYPGGSTLSVIIKGIINQTFIDYYTNQVPTHEFENKSCITPNEFDPPPLCSSIKGLVETYPDLYLNLQRNGGKPLSDYNIGDTLTYQLALGNSGYYKTQGGIVTIKLDMPGLKNISVSAPGFNCPTISAYGGTITTFEPKTDCIYTVTAIIDKPGSIGISGSITMINNGNELIKTLGNNKGSILEVFSIIGSLTATSTIGTFVDNVFQEKNNEFVVNDDIVYKVQLLNTYNAPISSLLFINTSPIGLPLTYDGAGTIAINGNNYSLTSISIPPRNGVFIYYLKAKANQSFINTYYKDPFTFSNTIEVDSPFDNSISITAAEGSLKKLADLHTSVSAQYGGTNGFYNGNLLDELTFLVTIKNQGLNDAINVQLSGTLSPSLFYPGGYDTPRIDFLNRSSADVDCNYTTQKFGSATRGPYQVGSLKPGERCIYKVTTTIVGYNTLSLSATSYEEPLTNEISSLMENNTHSASLTFLAPTGPGDDFSINKQIGATINGPRLDTIVFKPGDKLYWKITIQNRSNNTYQPKTLKIEDWIKPPFLLGKLNIESITQGFDFDRFDNSNLGIKKIINKTDIKPGDVIDIILSSPTPKEGDSNFNDIINNKMEINNSLNICNNDPNNNCPGNKQYPTTGKMDFAGVAIGKKPTIEVFGIDDIITYDITIQKIGNGTMPTEIIIEDSIVKNSDYIQHVEGLIVLPQTQKIAECGQIITDAGTLKRKISSFDPTIDSKKICRYQLKFKVIKNPDTWSPTIEIINNLNATINNETKPKATSKINVIRHETTISKSILNTTNTSKGNRFALGEEIKYEICVNDTRSLFDVSDSKPLFPSIFDHYPSLSTKTPGTKISDIDSSIKGSILYKLLPATQPSYNIDPNNTQTEKANLCITIDDTVTESIKNSLTLNTNTKQREFINYACLNNKPTPDPAPVCASVIGIFEEPTSWEVSKGIVQGNNHIFHKGDTITYKFSIKSTMKILPLTGVTFIDIFDNFIESNAPELKDVIDLSSVIITTSANQSQNCGKSETKRDEASRTLTGIIKDMSLEGGKTCDYEVSFIVKDTLPNGRRTLRNTIYKLSGDNQRYEGNKQTAVFEKLGTGSIEITKQIGAGTGSNFIPGDNGGIYKEFNMGDTLVWKITIRNNGKSTLKSPIYLQDIVQPPLIGNNIFIYDPSGELKQLSPPNKRELEQSLAPNEEYTFYIILKVPDDEGDQIIQDLLRNNNNTTTDHIELWTGNKTIYSSNTTTGKLDLVSYSLDKTVISGCSTSSTRPLDGYYTSGDIITYLFTIKAAGGTLTGATIVDIFKNITPLISELLDYVEGFTLVSGAGCQGGTMMTTPSSLGSASSIYTGVLTNINLGDGESCTYKLVFRVKKIPDNYTVFFTGINNVYKYKSGQYISGGTNTIYIYNQKIDITKKIIGNNQFKMGDKVTYELCLSGQRPINSVIETCTPKNITIYDHWPHIGNGIDGGAGWRGFTPNPIVVQGNGGWMYTPSTINKCITVTGTIDYKTNLFTGTTTGCIKEFYNTLCADLSGKNCKTVTGYVNTCTPVTGSCAIDIQKYYRICTGDKKETCGKDDQDGWKQNTPNGGNERYVKGTYFQYKIEYSTTCSGGVTGLTIKDIFPSGIGNLTDPSNGNFVQITNPYDLKFNTSDSWSSNGVLKGLGGTIILGYYNPFRVNIESGTICNEVYINTHTPTITGADKVCFDVFTPTCDTVGGSAIINGNITIDGNIKTIPYRCPDVAGATFAKAVLYDAGATAGPGGGEIETKTGLNPGSFTTNEPLEKIRIQCQYSYGVDNELTCPKEFSLPVCPPAPIASSTPSPGKPGDPITCRDAFDPNNINMKILGIPNPSKVSESYPKNTENVSCTYIGFNGIQGPGGDPYKLLCLGSVQLYDPSCSVVIDKKNITIVDDNPESINVKCENSGSIAGTIIKVHPASGFSPLGPSWTNPQLFSLELCPQEYTFTCSINGKECENSAQTICKCNPKNTTKYNPNGYPTTCEPTCTEEQKQNNEQATCNRYRESDCSIQTKIKLCIEDIKKYSRKECQSNGTCQSVATDKDNNGKDLCDNDQQCKGEAKCGTKHYECNPGVAVQKTEEDTDDKTTRKWRCETTYKTNTGLEIKVIAPPDPLRCEETKLKGRKCNTTSFSCDESCILDPADPSSSCLNPLDCTQQCKPPKCLINPVGSISQTILPNKPLNPINITCSDTNNALGGIVTLNVSPLLLGLPKSSPPSPVQFTVDSNLISTVGTRIFNCSIKAGGITSDDCNFALTTTKEFGKCKTPIYTPNEELFRDDPKDITVTCQGDNTLDATIKVFEFSGGPLIIEGKHQVTFKGDKETKYFVECTHDTETTKDPNVCTVEVPVKKREFECPPDTDYPNIITNPNFGGLDRDEGPPWTVLVGTKLVGGDCVGNLIGSDKKPKKFQTLGIKGAPISFDSLGETTQYCLIEFEGKIRECPFRIKTVKPKCELILSQAGESNLDLKVDIKDEGGSLLPQKLIPNIKQAGDCSVSKLPGVVLNGSSPSFSATVGNNKLSIGTYDAKCFFQPPKFIECSNTTAITKPNGDGCKDQLQINGITPIDAINDNNIIKVDTPTINIKCGGTLKFVPPTAEKNYKDGVYTFETAKDEVVVICSVNNLECAGKFSGKKGGTTGEKETPKTGDNQCNNNNKVDAGEECDGTAIDACKTKDPKITDWKCESCKCVGSGDTNNPNNTGNSSGPTDGGPPDPNKEPKCIVKLEMVKEREFGTLKHIFDIGSVGMPRNQFELSCGLAVPSNGKDVWKVHVGDVVTNTYEGLGIGAYKAICWVRKKGGGSGDWIKCEDGPMSILPPGSDTCDDKIVVNPGTQISGYPAIRRTVPGSQATATCNGGKITYPPGGILDFTKQSSYDLICTMDKGYVCSAKAMGNNDPNNPNNSGKSGGGNSNGGGGGAGGGGPGGGGPSDGYPPIFTGDPNAPNDVMITKIPNRVFVADGDLINRSMIVKHLGSGIVNRYTIVDTFPSNQLDYKVMSLSGNSNILSYCGYPSGSWNYSLTGNQLSGSVTNAGFWSGMSCEFTLTTQVKSGIGTGKITNQVCVTGVNNELSGWLANNCSQNSVTVIKACPNLSVIPDFGDNPLTSTYQCILSGSNTGYIQILNAKDILIKSYTGVKGSHTFDKPGYYYVECISKQFTGERCIRPVEVRELSECLDLNIKAPNNISGSIGNYQALCTGTDLGASYQLRLRQGTTNVNVGTTGKLIQVINSRSGSLTIPSAGVYSIQCLINGLVDYHFEYTTGLNKNTVYTKDNCPYKKLPGGGLCAVDVQVAPLKITFTNPSQFKNTLDPIVYCPNELVANLSCDIYNNTPMMIKNYNRCIKPIIIDQPDMVINKTGNKLIYSAPDTISYTITYTNTGSMTVNSLTIQDTMSEFGSIKINSISQSSQSGYSLITKQSSSSGILFELTGSIPGKKGGRITLQGAIQTGSNVPVKNKVILNTPGDKYLANNISEYIVYPSGRNFSGGALGDRVWSDTNFNGIQNSGEQGIKNIKVELVGCTGNQNIKDTTYTDIFGNYHFDGVSSGYYRIATTLISGYVFTYGKVGTDDTIDSDITIGNTTNCFYYDGIKHNLNKDIGLYDIRNVVGAKFCNYNNRAEYKLGEECDGTDGVFGPNERCIACKLFKLFPNCGDGIVQQGEGCDCSTVLPSGSTCVDCQIVTGSVCGNGKLEGLEECETTSAKIKGLQCINCKIVVNELGQCGNGIVEVGEMCDMGIANGTAVTITGGRFQGKSCSENCNAVDNICRVISKKNTPECTQVLSPDIMEGEFLPFWWDITNNQIISNTTKCTMGKIPADSVKCHFELYNGKSGTTTSPITSFIVPCINPSLYDKPLLGGFNPLSASYAGRSMLQLTSKYTNGIYGEYKLQLTKIDYAICNNSGSTQSKTITSTDRVICEYNFTVSRPFLIQIGNSLASNQNDSLNNFYGFSSNTKKMNILEQYGIKLTPLTLTKFKPSSSLNYLINQFATKQTLLAQKAIEFGPQTSKIPGSNIFIYEGNTILDNQILPMNTSSTIIVRHGNLTLSGSLKPTNMYIVPEGDVIFAGGCTIDQTIYGIILTPNKLLSDIPYANNNLLNKRCSGGGLTIMGTMVGNGWEDLIAKRRSKLEGWFLGVDYRNKYQSIVNGGSVSIVANPLINITPPPGWNEFGKTVELIK